MAVFQCLAVLKTAEFLPFIVFVAAPSMAALKVMYEEGRRFARGNKVGVVSAQLLRPLLSLWHTDNSHWLSCSPVNVDAGKLVICGHV